MARFSRKHAKHIDPKLRNRLRLYVVISGILLVVGVFDVVTGIVPIGYALISLIIGIVLGIISSRMYHLSWNHDAKQVVSRMDVFGVVILVLYILSALLRRVIIEQFVHGPAVWGVTFAFATGIMLGRVFGMRGRIIQVLKEQSLF